MIFLQKMKHSIIVGLGLAGLNYALQLQKEKKDFFIIDTGIKNASRNAAGICNPTVLKRYTMSWYGSEFIEYALPHYRSFESKINESFYQDLPIHKYFNRTSEQNDWSIASHKKELNKFLEPQITNNSNPGIKRKNGYGSVQNVGRLKVSLILDRFTKNLLATEYLNEALDYDSLEIDDNHVIYKGIVAQQIVFCEGYGLKKNPWFNYLPLKGSKGEYFLIKAPKLSRKQIVKGGVFILPMGTDLFWVGASFSSDDKTNEKTEKGKKWLLSKLENLLDTPYEIIYHGASIRPTVSDRRPLLGEHPIHKNLYIFNGLGTRGVLMAPLLSKWLFDFISEKKELPQAVAINRFETYFSSPKKKHV